MPPGMPERRTHDDQHHGTTAPFVACDAAIGICHLRHRAGELFDFLKDIGRAVPDDLEIHVVMDHDATR
jgi:hypothetical protein